MTHNTFFTNYAWQTGCLIQVKLKDSQIDIILAEDTIFFLTVLDKQTPNTQLFFFK